MPHAARTGALSCALAVAIGLSGAPSAAQDGGAPFGAPQDVRLAEEIWRVLADRRVVGDEAFFTHPYAGTSRHGPVLQYSEGEIAVGDRTGTVIVKKNHRGEGLSVDDVLAEPRAHLDSLAVMFRRAQGYAPEAADWFFVKYMPDGSVATTPGGRPMAGQVPPCIECHRPAEGGDFVFTHDRFAR
jgi:hypothetical protein